MRVAAALMALVFGLLAILELGSSAWWLLWLILALWATAIAVRKRPHTPTASVTPREEVAATRVQADHPKTPEDAEWELTQRFGERIGDLVGEVRLAESKALAVGVRDWYAGGSGHGFVAVLDITANRMLFKVQAKRPNNPHILPDGSVVYEDWWAPAGTLGGSLVKLGPDGTEAWRVRLKANVGTSGAARDGSRAYVVTLRSDFKAHSNKLFHVDGESGDVLWSRDFPGSDEPRYRVAFDGDDLVAIVEAIASGDERVFRFDHTGSLPREFDEFAFSFAVEHRGIVPVIAPRVRTALERQPPDLDEAEALLAMVDKHSVVREEQAVVWRLRGETSEARGHVEEAIKCFQAALAINPRIGVKGRLQRLQKQVG